MKKSQQMCYTPILAAEEFKSLDTPFRSESKLQLKKFWELKFGVLGTMEKHLTVYSIDKA